MINFLANISGSLLRGVYGFVAQMGTEPQLISYYAIALILTTVILRTIILPFYVAQINNQRKMAEVQPKLMELQAKYEDDPQLLMQKQQKLYKEEGFNPLAGCLPMLLQFPIIIAFYRMLQKPVEFAFKDPTFFANIQKNFFYIDNLDFKDPTGFVLGLVAALFTLLSTYVTRQNQTQQAMENDQTQATMQAMNIVMPIMIFMIMRNLPAGLGLYIITSTLYGIIQTLIVNHFINKKAQEEIEEAKRAEKPRRRSNKGGKR